MIARDALTAGTGSSFALAAIDRIAREGRAGHGASILGKHVVLGLAALGADVPPVWPALARAGVAALWWRASAQQVDRQTF
jgi:hypothetical protein